MKKKIMSTLVHSYIKYDNKVLAMYFSMGEEDLNCESMLTLRSGMLNLWLTERLLVRAVAAIILSHVCWQVFSPGAEINQNSVMVTVLVQLEETERRAVCRLMCAAF